MRQQLPSVWLLLFWIFSTNPTIYGTKDPITAMTQCSNTANSGDFKFWMAQFNSLGLSDHFSGENIGRKFACQLNNLQELLEYDGTSEKHQFGPLECIQQNDPVLYQVLISLIETVIKTKHAIIEEGSYDLISMKSQLEFAAMFLAKRNQISWKEIVPLNGINSNENHQQDIVLREAITLWDEQKCDNQNEWGNNDNEGGKQNRQNSDQKPILRLTLTAIEDAEKIIQKLASKKQKRRRRRRKKRANDPPYVYDPWTGRNYTQAEWEQLQIKGFKDLMISFVIAVTVGIAFFCVLNCLVRGPRVAGQRQVIAGAQQPAVIQTNRLLASHQLNPRLGPKFVEEFNKFPIKYIGAEERECSICLSNIEPRTEVRPMPACKHVFHGSCIEIWLLSGHTLCPICRVPIFIVSGETVRANVQNVAGSYENGVVPQIELTILGENQNEAAAGSNNFH